jgi:hypothetical protein
VKKKTCEEPTPELILYQHPWLWIQVLWVWAWVHAFLPMGYPCSSLGAGSGEHIVGMEVAAGAMSVRREPEMEKVGQGQPQNCTSEMLFELLAHASTATIFLLAFLVVFWPFGPW